MVTNPHSQSNHVNLTLEVAQGLLKEAAERPWLASLLLHRKQWLCELTQRLRNLSRQTRRLFHRALTTGLSAVAMLAAVLLWTSPVHAGTITVDGTACTLADAISTANTGTNTGGCSGGSAGADTIDLQTAVTLTAALPDITTAITIEGNGYTIQRNSGAPDFGVLKVTSAGNLTLKQATITGGHAGNGGGIHNYGTLTVQDSTITGNTATAGYGGGIFTSGTATVQNSTISDNYAASYGGGITNSNGTLTIQNSTITGNSANYNGSGIYQGSTGTSLVQNSIIALQSSGVDCYTAIGTITSQGYNIESAATCNFTSTGDQRNVNSGSLNLGALADNGGPTLTHALGSGSVAIDKISTGVNGCTAGTSIDQRNAWRANGTDKGGSACDVGAYEANSLYDSVTAVTLRSLVASTGSSVGVVAAFVAAVFASAAGWLGWRRRQT